MLGGDEAGTKCVVVAMVNDDPSPSEIAEAADTGRHCDFCDYNLTGLTENRCPECGRPFDLKRNPEPRVDLVYVVLIFLHGLMTSAVVLMGMPAIGIYLLQWNDAALYFGLMFAGVQFALLVIGTFLGAIAAAAKPMKPLWLAFTAIGVVFTLANGLAIVCR